MKKRTSSGFEPFRKCSTTQAMAIASGIVSCVLHGSSYAQTAPEKPVLDSQLASLSDYAKKKQWGAPPAIMTFDPNKSGGFDSQVETLDRAIALVIRRVVDQVGGVDQLLSHPKQKELREVLTLLFDSMDRMRTAEGATSKTGMDREFLYAAARTEILSALKSQKAYFDALSEQHGAYCKVAGSVPQNASDALVAFEATKAANEQARQKARTQTVAIEVGTKYAAGNKLSVPLDRAEDIIRRYTDPSSGAVFQGFTQVNKNVQRARLILLQILQSQVNASVERLRMDETPGVTPVDSSGVPLVGVTPANSPLGDGTVFSNLADILGEIASSSQSVRAEFAAESKGSAAIFDSLKNACDQAATQCGDMEKTAGEHLGNLCKTQKATIGSSKSMEALLKSLPIVSGTLPSEPVKKTEAGPPSKSKNKSPTSAVAPGVSR